MKSKSLYHVFMQRDVIIVLGSGIGLNGKLLPKGIKRVEKAVELYKDKLAKRIIVSGGYFWQREDIPPRTEAEAMKEMAVSLGVPGDKVFGENRSRDTMGNLFFTKIQYLEPKHWRNLVIVTSNYHLDRVQFLCEKVLGSSYVFEVEGVDADMPPDELNEHLEHESRKIAFVHENLENIPDGDDEMLKYIILKHPGYKDDPAIMEWLS